MCIANSCKGSIAGSIDHTAMLKDTTLTLLLNVSGERPSRERKAGVLFPQPPLIFCATRTYNTHAPFHMAKQTTKGEREALVTKKRRIESVRTGISVSVIRNVEEESNGLHSTIKVRPSDKND